MRSLENKLVERNVDYYLIRGLLGKLGGTPVMILGNYKGTTGGPFGAPVRERERERSKLGRFGETSGDSGRWEY